jgi:3-oxoadipate enol-lactonase
MPLMYLPDIRLNIRLDGPDAAPPLVLLHALGNDSTLFDPIMPLLPGLRILRPDLRGHGASDVPAPPYTMGALIHDVERLMDQCTMKDAVVLGVSLGGLIAQGLAIKRLDLVRAMVLSNTAARIGSPAMWSDRAAQIAATGLEPYANGAMERMFGRTWRTEPAMPTARNRLVTTHPQGWIGCAMAIAGTDFFTPTAALTLPTLVIAGDRDATTPPDLVRETADLIKGSQFHLIRGAGHLPLLDKPTQYATLLTDFLRRIGHLKTPRTPNN